MTDLKNGIIEINGYEIHAGTTPEDIIHNLNGIYINHSKSSSGKSESFTFDNISIYNCKFSIDVCFYLGKLETIKLESYHEYDGEHSWEKAFALNNQWLEEHLGKADTSSIYSRGYDYSSCHIRSMYLADPRWGDESFIDIRFGE